MPSKPQPKASPTLISLDLTTEELRFLAGAIDIAAKALGAQIITPEALSVLGKLREAAKLKPETPVAE